MENEGCKIRSLLSRSSDAQKKPAAAAAAVDDDNEWDGVLKREEKEAEEDEPPIYSLQSKCVSKRFRETRFTGWKSLNLLESRYKTATTLHWFSRMGLHDYSDVMKENNGIGLRECIVCGSPSILTLFLPLKNHIKFQKRAL